MASHQIISRPRLRIMHLIDDDGAGGGPVVVCNLMTYLSNYHDQIAAYGGDGLIAALCKQRGWDGHKLPFRRKSFLFVAFFPFVKLLRAKRPDVLINHGPFAGPMGAIAARCAGIRHVIYIPQFPSFYTDWDLLRIIRNRLVELIACNYSSRVVVNSKGNFYQYLVRRLLDGKKSQIIHNAVGPEKIASADERLALRNKFGWSDDCCHVVSVGRLADQKCLHWLLESWKIVEQSNAAARLWIVGGGDEEAHLKHLSSTLGLKFCSFMGSQKNGHHFIGAADIVAMTSLYEGHANVPLEALVNGRPIVASDVDGICDTIRSGIDGFLVPAGDVRSFANRLIELIQSAEKRSALGAQARIRALDFHPNNIYPSYLALLDDLIEESHKPI